MPENGEVGGGRSSAANGLDWIIWKEKFFLQKKSFKKETKVNIEALRQMGSVGYSNAWESDWDGGKWPNGIITGPLNIEAMHQKANYLGFEYWTLNI